MVRIRQARCSDKQGIDLLLRGLDGSSPIASLQTLVDPRRSLSWIATVGDRVVGISCAQIRSLSRGPDKIRVGYWTNLCIDPEYRDQMLYPMLPMRMFQSLKKNDVSFLYAAIRRPRVTEAHLKIGLKKIGSWGVFLKPLRPARLLIRHKGLSSLLQTVSRPMDGVLSLASSVYRQGFKLVSGAKVLRKVQFSQLADLMAVSSGQKAQQGWSEMVLRERYSNNPDASYQIYGTGEPLSAVVICRNVKRENGLVVCVVLDIRYQLGHEADARGLLLQAEANAVRDDCDGMLVLDSYGPVLSFQFRMLGYVRTPEIYTLMVWPKKVTERNIWMLDIENWCFGFGDHDAF